MRGPVRVSRSRCRPPAGGRGGVPSRALLSSLSACAPALDVPPANHRRQAPSDHLQSSPFSRISNHSAAPQARSRIAALGAPRPCFTLRGVRLFLPSEGVDGQEGQGCRPGHAGSSRATGGALGQAVRLAVRGGADEPRGRDRRDGEGRVLGELDLVWCGEGRREVDCGAGMWWR